MYLYIHTHPYEDVIFVCCVCVCVCVVCVSLSHFYCISLPPSIHIFSEHVSHDSITVLSRCGVVSKEIAWNVHETLQKQFLK